MTDNDIKKVLITGSDGYIGSVLSASLVKKGYTVTGVDTFYYEDCVFVPNGQRPVTVRKDVRDLSVQDLRGYDAIIHLAALSNDPLGALAPQLTMEINFRASFRLAQFAKEAGIQRFLYASSCSLYGRSDEEWVDESSEMVPLTAYARSKVQTEAALQKLADGTFSPIILRCATVCGLSPKLRLDLVVNNLVAWGVTKNEIRILSDGTPWRPLIHVDDLVAAYEFLLEAPRDQVHNRPLNVGFSDQNYQVRYIAELIGEQLPQTRVTFAAEPERDARSYRVRFDKFADLYQREPRWDMKTTVQSLIRAYQQQGMKGEELIGRNFVRLNQLQYLLSDGRIDAELRWRIQ